MLLKFKRSSDASEHQVTDEAVFHQRRHLLKSLGFLGASAAISQSPSANAWWGNDNDKPAPANPQTKLAAKPTAFGQNETSTGERLATSYNNFYEFGTDKDAPAKHAGEMTIEPWQISVAGACENPFQLSADDLISTFELQERVYRLRCVEAWSMVVPWIGFPLAKLLKLAKPTAAAKYVEFKTLYRPAEMRGQRNRFVGGGIDYPYVEGLRIDEAMHDLTLVAVGMYGKTLPNQNGAPIRLVVPWKYGFKSIKSIVSIRFVEQQPRTTWQQLAPNEYGFFANVNPQVDHPRWSQARERRLINSSLLGQERIDTKLFNGYDQVAPLYAGMDLTKYY